MEESFVKNWSLRCNLAFCSLYGVLYTKEISKFANSKFTKTIYSYESSVGSQFLLESDLVKFFEPFAKVITKNPKKGKFYCKKVIAKTNSLFKMVSRFEKKKELSLADFELLTRGLYAQVPPNLVIKRVGEYLHKELMDSMLEDMTKARLATELLYPKVITVIDLFLKQIESKEHVSFELLRYLTHEEILVYFKKGKLPSESELKKRTGGVILVYQNGTYNLLVGLEFEKLKSVVYAVNQNGFVKGKTAFGGKIIGIVRIIFHPKRVNEFNVGDVLVTGMTRPDFIPLMQKASAFVTDAGGILSHAAITAREMKKPCVIGTGNATKILKDGQRVEVDANSGTVRVI